MVFKRHPSRRLIAIGTVAFTGVAVVAGVAFQGSSGANESAAPASPVALAPVGEHTGITSPTTTVVGSTTTAKRQPATNASKPTPAAPARPGLYKVIAQTSDQNDLAWYATKFGVSIEGGWGSDGYFVFRLKDTQKNVHAFVFSANGKSYDVEVVPGGAEAQFEIGELGIYESTSYPLLRSVTSGDLWLIDASSRSFIAVDPASVRLDLPPAPARPELYKVVALTSDQDDLAWYDKTHGVSVGGGWTDSADYFIFRLKDTVENKIVFVFTSGGTSYGVVAIDGDAESTLVMGAPGTYEGKHYPLLERTDTNELWLVDASTKSFISVDPAKVTR